MKTEYKIFAGVALFLFVLAIQLMKEGAVYQFVIPPDLAYGAGGSPPTIPPNATLVFRIELIAVK